MNNKKLYTVAQQLVKSIGMANLRYNDVPLEYDYFTVIQQGDSTYAPIVEAEMSDVTIWNSVADTTRNERNYPMKEIQTQLDIRSRKAGHDLLPSKAISIRHGFLMTLSEEDAEDISWLAEHNPELAEGVVTYFLFKHLKEVTQ